MAEPTGLIFPLADRLYDGKLAQHLRRWRSDGESFRAISLRMRDDGVEVSDETVRAWCHRLGIEDAA